MTVNTNINYRRSVFIGQVLIIETGVVRKGRKSVTMKQKVFLRDTGTLIADADVKNVFLDLNTGKTMLVNDEFNSFWLDLAEINNQETESPSNMSISGKVK